MADDKLKDELLTDDELDNVAGGTYTQTFRNMDTFTNGTNYKFHGTDSDKRDQLRTILFSCGIKLKDHGGSHDNEYHLLDKQGNKIRSLGENEAMRIAINNYNAGNFIC